jgi:hypothetical protein
MSMPAGGQSLAPTENVGRGFILRSAPPAERAVLQPHQVEMPIQSVMSGKKSSNPPGLLPTEGQELGPVPPIRSRDQLPSLSSTHQLHSTITKTTTVETLTVPVIYF